MSLLPPKLPTSVGLRSSAPESSAHCKSLPGYSQPVDPSHQVSVWYSRSPGCPACPLCSRPPRLSSSPSTPSFLPPRLAQAVCSSLERPVSSAPPAGIQPFLKGLAHSLPPAVFSDHSSPPPSSWLQCPPWTVLSFLVACRDHHSDSRAPLKSLKKERARG